MTSLIQQIREYIESTKQDIENCKFGGDDDTEIKYWEGVERGLSDALHLVAEHQKTLKDKIVTHPYFNPYDWIDSPIPENFLNALTEFLNDYEKWLGEVKGLLLGDEK